jgi:hypothetical protein
MNMKKTIAAAAAGAMAVSATATAASAATATTPELQTQGTYVYSLVKNFAKEKNGTATIQSEKTIPITVSPTTSSIYINLRDYTTGTLSGTAYPVAGTGSYLDVKTDKPATLTVQSQNDNSVLINRTFQLDGDGRDFDGSAYDGLTIYRAGATLATKGTASDIGIDQGTLANRATVVLVRYKTEVEHKLEKSTSLVNLLTGNNQLLSIDAASTLAFTTFYAGVTSTAVITEANYVNANSILSSIYVGGTYRVPTNFVAYDPDGTIFSAPMMSNTNTTRYGGGVPNIIEYLEGKTSNTTAGAWNQYYVMQTPGKGTSWFPVANTNAFSVRELQYIGSSEAKEWKAEWAGSTEALAHTKDYTNVMALLNDTIANYDVTFVFQTAVQPVMDGDDGDRGADHPGGAYDTEKGDSTYMSFSQHLYGGYGNDPTNNVPFGSAYFNNGINYNLFTGGLIVNDYYSMQLADTTMFSYSVNTLSFSFNDLKDKAYANYNSWMDYVQSLRLATSTEWYWDNLSIQWAAPVADTAESGEGIESDDVTLEDDVPADAGEEEVVVPEEEVPAAPAPNPATGNSAVALAVIPVALAAAAIVAKKRK